MQSLWAVNNFVIVRMVDVLTAFNKYNNIIIKILFKHGKSSV